MQSPLLDALLLNAGYNAALAAIGSALLGAAAGAAGAFLLLRKRALISDAVAHATLPGVGFAFLAMAALGGDGRNLLGLMAGSALSAWIGLMAVGWIVERTRLTEDAAIGAVLSSFFGLGVVLLTVIQTLSMGRQAGLEGFLLGSAAGMLFQDALIIAGGGALTVAAVGIFRRPLTLVAFDPEAAAAMGYRVGRIDRLAMALALAVTVIGMKIVGMVLIVALLIIPPVAARFWTERAEGVAWLGAGIGGFCGYLGAAISASVPAAPTGPIVVLCCSGVFLVSLLLAPSRGVLAAAARWRRFQRRAHRRQGLLALARGDLIHDAFTLRVLRRGGLIRPDGVATEAGRAQAAKALRDEKRWEVARRLDQDAALTGRYDGLTPIETVLTADEIAEIDRRLGPPQEIT